MTEEAGERHFHKLWKLGFLLLNPATSNRSCAMMLMVKVWRTCAGESVKEPNALEKPS